MNGIMFLVKCLWLLRNMSCDFKGGGCDVGFWDFGVFLCVCGGCWYDCYVCWVVVVMYF